MSNYAIQDYKKEHMARALGRGLPISFKQSVEVCNYIRGKQVNTIKKILNDVKEKKKSIPFRRFKNGAGHKKVGAAGKYPVKTVGEIIKLVETAEANAQFKGLNTSNLIIKHVCAHKGGKAWHYGRKRGRKMKRTNVEIVVEEKALKKPSKDTEKGLEKAKLPQKEKKTEEKKEVKETKQEKKVETKVKTTEAQPKKEHNHKESTKKKEEAKETKK